jgi:hypothetical protein
VLRSIGLLTGAHLGFVPGRIGRGVLYAWIVGFAGGTETDSRVFCAKASAIPRVITNAYATYRAQIRIMRQREETKIPLTRIIEMRRKLFTELKVDLLPLVLRDSHSLPRQCKTSRPKWETNDPLLRFVSRRTVNYWQQEAGRAL